MTEHTGRTLIYIKQIEYVEWRAELSRMKKTLKTCTHMSAHSQQWSINAFQAQVRLEKTGTSARREIEDMTNKYN